MPDKYAMPPGNIIGGNTEIAGRLADMDHDLGEARLELEQARIEAAKSKELASQAATLSEMFHLPMNPESDDVRAIIAGIERLAKAEQVSIPQAAALVLSRMSRRQGAGVSVTTKSVGGFLQGLFQ